MTKADSGLTLDARRGNALFATLLLIINLVMDGLPKFAPEVPTQLFLLPLTITFAAVAYWFLFPAWSPRRKHLEVYVSWIGTPKLLGWMIPALETLFTLLLLYQARHYAAFGYHLTRVPASIVIALIVASIAGVNLHFRNISPLIRLTVYLLSYAAGQILSILNFPLSYLRSDMLPVIFWADRSLIHGMNPYQHFYVADRIYDFPYLPGTLLAFLPALALGVDLRWTCLVYLVAGMMLIYWETAPKFKNHAALLIGLVLLCPYLQYRHDLYTQPHYLSLILIFVLAHRRIFAWSAAAFGLSMVISQFSWVIFPFFVLNAYRRGGLREASRMTSIAAATALVLYLPFLRTGAASIAHNTVGQWDLLMRPIARPINLAFWATYLVRPSNLKWVQLVLLSFMFFYCWVKGRCSDLLDTLRWMIAALIIFILFNVLIDGYFYLMLLVPMLIYTCVANGWWSRDTMEADF